MKLLKYAAIAAGMLALAGTSQAQKMVQKIGKGEGQVDIVAWAGYIERGATVKEFDWVTGFEKATGCKVNVKTAGTSDEMVALMNEGGFDLVTASGDASTRLIRGKKVQPINISLIPSWSKVDPRLQDAPWHTVDGEHYGTPYQWGSNVLMYNTDVFPEAPTSWNVVFEEQTLSDGKSNTGRMAQGFNRCVAQRGIGDKCLGIAVVDDVANLFCFEVVVDRCEPESAAHGCSQGFNELGPVFGDDGNSIASLQATFAQAAGQSIRVPVQVTERAFTILRYHGADIGQSFGLPGDGHATLDGVFKTQRILRC